jgi:hypothetical protein
MIHVVVSVDVFMWFSLCDSLWEMNSRDFLSDCGCIHVVLVR